MLSLFGQQRRPIDTDAQTSGGGFQGQGDQGYVVAELPTRDKVMNVHWTFSDLDKDTSLIPKQSLYVNHTINNSYCADSMLKRATLYARLTMGHHDYTFGLTKFLDTVTFRLQAYDSNGFNFANDTIRLGIENDSNTTIRPEQLYRRIFTDTYYKTDSFRITVLYHSSTFPAASKFALRDSLLFEVYYVDEFKTKAYNVGDSSHPAIELIPQDTVVDANPVTFHWNRITECVNDTFPNYQFQLLRLFNREVENPDHDERNIVDIVDWSRALTIETGSPKTELTLTLAEGTGYYVWRVRPIGDYYPGGIANDRNWGVWSYAPGDSAHLAIPATDRASLDASIRPSIFFYKQFDGDKNWVYGRSFSEGEEGTRIAETMTYATSLLQNRQSQAHMQSKEKILVNQTVLDFSGRPSLISLAAPVEQDGFSYQSQFLKAANVGSGSHLYTAEDFDADANAEDPAKIVGGPVADYYSDSNPDTRVPSAEGYPFTRPFFYPDATGRIAQQSGAGDVHRLGSSASGHDRTVKTYYGNPSEEELVAMFGDEAPADSTVQKIVTVDPNKVISVRYASKEGQTLATCLVKTLAPEDTSLVDLSETQIYNQTSHQGLGTNTRLGDYGAVASTTIVLPEATSVNMLYKLTPKTIEGACGSYCAVCDYTVTFRIYPSTNPSEVVFEHSKTVPPVSCDSAHSGGSTSGGGATARDTMAVVSLGPGSFVVERTIIANNLAPNGRHYIDNHVDSVANIIRGQTDQALDSVRRYLDSANLDGLYSYLNGRIHDDPTHVDTLQHDSTGRAIYRLKSEASNCWEISFTKQTCDDDSPCGTPVRSFEQVLYDKWGDQFGTTLEGYFFDGYGHNLYPRSGPFASSGGKGMFDSMIVHMVADGYDCKTLWHAWNRLVGTFPYVATTNGSGDPAKLDRTYDLLDAFLHIVGKEYVGVADCPYGDCTSQDTYGYGKGYLEYAYKYFEYRKRDEYFHSFIEGNRDENCENSFGVHDLILHPVVTYIGTLHDTTFVHVPPGGSPVWAQDTLGVRFDSVMGKRVKKNWEDFHDCVRAGKQPPRDFRMPADCDPPGSEDCMLASKESNENLCRSACENRVPSFRRAVREEYYKAGKIVEGDLVTPDGHKVSPDGYLLDTAGVPTDSLVPSVSLSDVECQVQTLLQHCEEGCTLTVIRTGGHITQIGTEAEKNHFIESMSYGFKVALPVSGSCADSSMTLLSNADAHHSFARRAVRYLNDSLSSFRYHGGDTASPDSIARWFYNAFSSYTGLTGCRWYEASVPIDTSYSGCCPPEGMPGIFTLRSGITSEFVLDGCMLVYVRHCRIDSTSEMISRDTLCSDICYDSCAGEICFKWMDLIAGDTTGVIYPFTCADLVARRLRVAIDQQQGEIIDRAAADMRAQYMSRCVAPAMIDDALDIAYTQTLYHFTLYYYDRAGHLVKTVPPLGVKLVQPLPTPRRSTHPAHVMATVYEYNSLGQILRSETPDGGVMRFWYDAKGRKRFMQDARQFSQALFSYVKYDSLGRTVETGENRMTGPTVLDDSVDYQPYPSVNSTDVVATVYSAPGTVGYMNDGGSPQRFTQNRVSYTKTKDITTEYSYDPHGNVEWMMHSITGLGNNFIKYRYDLVSNNVLGVYLNEGRRDGYAQRYSYDEDNRITKVESSRDTVIWDRDASYFYYDHGPLRRAEYGEDSLQGVDYTYTIQGWLKALNHPGLDPTKDPGGDGDGSSTYAPDAFGMVLGYYPGDFGRTGSIYNSGGSHTADAENLSAPWPLYNGNISSWTSKNYVPASALACQPKATTLNGDIYHYDRLNRLVTDSWKLRNGSSWNSPADFFSSYQYDANGNILTLTRNGCTAGGWGHIDSLTYQYANPGVNNLLDHVDDKIAAGVSANDLDDQAAANYAYDADGNMTGDVQEGISSIKWTSYGKVERVVKGMTQQRFKYDPAGNRIKVVLDNEEGSSGYYIREAGGKVLARYIKAGVDRDDYESVTDGCIHTNSKGQPYDSDQDGVPDDKDNAPGFPNSDQGDADHDGIADVLDPDIDNDGIGNFTDACPFDPLNSCAGDHDSDGVPDSLDPCPQYPGYPGDDTDHDGIPDNCDGDLDGDGIPNHEDNCVHVYNPDQADADTNGIGDACQCLSGNGGGGTSVPDVRIGMFYVYGNTTNGMVAEVDPFFGDLGERDTVTHADTIFTRRLRFKRYDLKDHLDNAREQYSDLKLDDNHQGAGPWVIDYQFHANYYPFGMLQEGRSNPQVAGDYLYNGKEDDRTWNNGKNTGTGGGNSYDYGYRIYNPRLARFLSVDPLAPEYPWYTPYQFAGNKPIRYTDLDGLEEADPQTYTTPAGTPINIPAGAVPRFNSSVSEKIRIPSGALIGFNYGGESYHANYYHLDNDKWVFGGYAATRINGGEAKDVYYVDPTHGQMPPLSLGVQIGSVLALAPEEVVKDIVIGANPLIAIGVLPFALAGDNELPYTGVGEIAPELPSDEQRITLYRGLRLGRSGYGLAMMGIAIPEGIYALGDKITGHDDPELHNDGNTHSIYTSWTTDERTGLRFANQEGLGGILLVKSFRVSETVPSPDRFGEYEVLVPGIVRGAEVHYVLPNGQKAN